MPDFRKPAGFDSYRGFTLYSETDMKEDDGTEKTSYWAKPTIGRFQVLQGGTYTPMTEGEFHAEVDRILVGEKPANVYV